MSQSVLSGDSRVGINNQHLLEKVNGYRVSLGTTVDKSRGSRDGKDFTKFTV